MRTVEALKNLYTALGGTLSDIENITNISDVVNAISAIAGGGLVLKKGTHNSNTTSSGEARLSRKLLPKDFVALTGIVSCTVNGSNAVAVQKRISGITPNMDDYTIYYSIYGKNGYSSLGDLTASNLFKEATNVEITYLYLAKA